MMDTLTLDEVEQGYHKLEQTILDYTPSKVEVAQKVGVGVGVKVAWFSKIFRDNKTHWILDNDVMI